MTPGPPISYRRAERGDPRPALDGSPREMTMRRRLFLKAALAAVAFITAPVAWILGRVVPARYVEAIRTRRFPGRLKEICDADIQRPGRWGG